MKKLKGSYFAYALLYGAYFFGMGIFCSILSVYLAGVGKSAKEISLIVSAGGLFTMILQPFIGIAYDRLRRDRVVTCVLLALSAVFGVAFAFLKSSAMLFLFNGFAMAFLNGVNPICERMATSTGYRYGTIRLWGAVGYAAASQAAGWTYESISSTVNFFLFGAAAACTVFAFLLTEGSSQPVPEKRKDDSRGLFSSMMTNPGFLLFTFISFLFSGAAGANSTYLPLLLQQLMGSTTYVGTLLFLGTMMELPVILCSARYMDRLSGRTLMLIDFLLLIVQFAVYALAPETALVAAVLFLCKSTATMLFIMITLKAVLSLVDSRCSATALSIAATARSAGSFVISYAAGAAADTFGLKSVFVILLTISLIGFVLTFFLKTPKSDPLFGGKTSEE